MSARNLVVSGGPLHDFAATTAALVDLASQAGVESYVPPDPGAALDLLADDPAWELVTVNALLWSMPAERHAELRDAWSFRLTEHQAEGLRNHVERGGGMLACHTAPICFDDHPGWRAVLGAGWDWDRSSHPPPRPSLVERTDAGARHPVTAGLGAFEIDDEIYTDLDADDDLVPLLTCAVDGTDQPLLWTRSLGAGRVVVSLLGHDAEAYAHPSLAAVVRASVRWLVAEGPIR